MLRREVRHRPLKTTHENVYADAAFILREKPVGIVGDTDRICAERFARHEGIRLLDRAAVDLELKAVTVGISPRGV